MAAKPGAADRARIPGGRDGRRMLAVTLLDRIGSGLWASVSVLYFTYVSHLSAAQVGTLAAVSGAIGIAGAPLGGRLADRFSLTHVLIALQLLRALASFALLTTDHYGLLVAYSALGALGDRAANILTRLYATRVAGPDRVRYQAINRTASNAGWALGGLAAAAALTLGTTTAYRWLLTGDALSFVLVALLTLTCAEPPPRAESPPSPRTHHAPAPAPPGATAPISPTSVPRPSSSSTTPTSRSACRCGSPTPQASPTASHPCSSCSTACWSSPSRSRWPASAPPPRQAAGSSYRSPPPSPWAASP